MNLSIYLSIHLSIYRSIYRSIYLSIYLSVNLSIHPSIDLSIYGSIYRSIYQSVCLSVYLSIFLSIYLLYYVVLSLSLLIINASKLHRNRRSSLFQCVPSFRLQARGKLPPPRFQPFTRMKPPPIPASLLKRPWPRETTKSLSNIEFHWLAAYSLFDRSPKGKIQPTGLLHLGTANETGSKGQKL